MRIHGGQRDGEIVALTAPKCLIGSDERCQLRLPELDRVSAWVLRGARHTVARTIGTTKPDNAAAFVDRLLTAGDRLDLGPCALEILDADRPRRRQNRAERMKATADAAAQPLPRSLMEELNQVQRRIQQAVEATRAQAEELQTWEQQRRQAWETGQRELNSLREQFERQQRTNAENRDQWTDRLADAEQRLQRRVDQIADNLDEIRNRQSQWLAAEHAARAQLHELIAALVQRLDNLVSLSNGAAEPSGADRLREISDECKKLAAGQNRSDELATRLAEGLEAIRSWHDQWQSAQQQILGSIDQQLTSLADKLTSHQRGHEAGNEQVSTWQLELQEQLAQLNRQRECLSAGQLALGRQVEQVLAELSLLGSWKPQWEAFQERVQGRLEEQVAALGERVGAMLAQAARGGEPNADWGPQWQEFLRQWQQQQERLGQQQQVDFTPPLEKIAEKLDALLAWQNDFATRDQGAAGGEQWTLLQARLAILESGQSDLAQQGASLQNQVREHLGQLDHSMAQQRSESETRLRDLAQKLDAILAWQNQFDPREQAAISEKRWTSIREMFESLASAQSRLAEQLLTAQARLDEVLSQFQSWRDGLVAPSLELQRQLSELSSAHEQLAGQRLELSAQRESLAQEREALARQRAELEQVLQRPDSIPPEAIDSASGLAADAPRQQLEQRDAELQRRAAELDSRDAMLTQRFAELKRSSEELDAQAASLKLRYEELEAQSTELARLRSEFEDRRAAAEGECRREFKRLEQVRRELSAERERLQRLRADAADEARHRPEPAENVAIVPPGEDVSKPAGSRGDADSVFRRLEAAGILKRHEGEEEAADWAEPEAAGQPTAPPANAGPPAHEIETEEESIDQYMAKLLERARQNTGQAREYHAVVTPPVLPGFCPAAEEERPPREVETNAKVVDEAAPPAESGRAERTRRAMLNHDLTAMRELANLSARTALHHYHRRQQTYLVSTKVTIFLVSAATAAFGLLRGIQPGSVFWYAAMAAVVIAVLYGAQVGFLFLRILYARKGRDARQLAPTGTPSANVEALPADDIGTDRPGNEVLASADREYRQPD
jgi:chromosome segregation ATPase